MVEVCVIIVDGISEGDLISQCLNIGHTGFVTQVHKDDMFLIVARGDVSEDEFTQDDIIEISNVEVQQLYDKHGEYVFEMDNGMHCKVYQ